MREIVTDERQGQETLRYIENIFAENIMESGESS